MDTTLIPLSQSPENDQLQQRQMLMKAMMQQGLAGPQGNVQSPLAAIAPALQLFLAQKLGQQNSLEAAKLREADQAGTQKDLASFLQQYKGAPGQTLTDGQASALMNDNVDPQAKGPLAEPVQANPHAAILGALSSRYPTVQAVGQAELPKFLATANAQPKFAYHDGAILREDPGASVPVKVGTTKTPEKWELQDMVNPADGKTYKVRVNTATNKPENILPGGGTTVNVGEGTAETAAAKAYGGKVPDILEKSSQAVQAAQSQVDAADRTLAAVKDTVVSGFGANFELGAKALAKKFGWDDKDAVANTQTMMTDMSKRTLDAGQQMKGSFSDNDIIFLKEVSGGSITLTPEAMQRVAALAKLAAHNQGLQALRQYEGAANGPGGSIAQAGFPRPEIGWQMDPSIYEPVQGRTDAFRVKAGAFASPPSIPAQLPANPANPASAHEAPGATVQREMVINGRKIPITIHGAGGQ